MKKTVLIYIILFLTPFFLHSEVHEKPVQLSVLYFSNNSSTDELKWLEKGIADMLTTDLSYSDGIITIEREKLEEIISEQKLNLSGLIDDNEKIEVGKLLKADYLITGSFLAVNNLIRYDFKILNTETGEIHSAGKAEGSIATLLRMKLKLHQLLSGALISKFLKN